MAKDASKGIHSEHVTVHASSLEDQRHRFVIETSLRQVIDLYIPDALYQHAATKRFVGKRSILGALA